MLGSQRERRVYAEGYKLVLGLITEEEYMLVLMFLSFYYPIGLLALLHRLTLPTVSAIELCSLRLNVRYKYISIYHHFFRLYGLIICAQITSYDLITVQS